MNKEKLYSGVLFGRYISIKTCLVEKLMVITKTHRIINLLICDFFADFLGIILPLVLYYKKVIDIISNLKK